MTVKETIPVRNSELADDDDAIIQPIGFTPAPVSPGRKQFWLSPQSIVVAGFMLLGALILIFLLAARSLIFETQPADADISVSGAALPLGDGHLLLPGHYNYTISATGYRPKNGQVEVTGDSNIRHAVNLEPLPGHLRVVSDPAVPVKILIDGTEFANEQGLAKAIPAGRKRITILSERYLPFNKDMEIEGLDNTQTLRLTLRPAWAKVHISSKPPGATIAVAEKVLGTTPLTTELIQGERQIHISLSGHKTAKIPVPVTAGVDQTLDTVELAAADGLLRLASNPLGASVTVDGEYRGLTPLKLQLASNTRHQLRLFKDGYRSVTRDINISPDADRELAVTLTVVFGKILVSSSPPDAQVYIDGELAGVSGQAFRLPTRSHQISVRKKGYLDYQTAIVPSARLEQNVRAVLLTSEQARWNNIPTKILHGARGSMELMRPNALFTMGSSRREQGRRANEVMRQVSLTKAFYIGTTEVTNREYRRFKPLHSSSHANGVSLDNDRLPVVNVNWNDTALFCNWLSARDGLKEVYRSERGLITGFDASANGYRLPTEAEWAWTARYDRGTMKKFPWGNSLPVAKDSGNYADSSAAHIVPAVLRTYSDLFAATAPVASFAPNDAGIFDLGGNVSEWVHDLYTIGTGLSLKREENPVGPQDGDYHVIRGSSWKHSGLTELRLSYRDYGAEAGNDIGFRLARWVH